MQDENIVGIIIPTISLLFCILFFILTLKSVLMLKFLFKSQEFQPLDSHEFQINRRLSFKNILKRTMPIYGIFSYVSIQYDIPPIPQAFQLLVYWLATWGINYHISATFNRFSFEYSIFFGVLITILSLVLSLKLHSAFINSFNTRLKDQSIKPQDNSTVLEIKLQENDDISDLKDLKLIIYLTLPTILAVFGGFFSFFSSVDAETNVFVPALCQTLLCCALDIIIRIVASKIIQKLRLCAVYESRFPPLSIPIEKHMISRLNHRKLLISSPFMNYHDQSIALNCSLSVSPIDADNLEEQVIVKALNLLPIAESEPEEEISSKLPEHIRELSIDTVASHNNVSEDENIQRHILFFNSPKAKSPLKSQGSSPLKYMSPVKKNANQNLQILKLKKCLDNSEESESDRGEIKQEKYNEKDLNLKGVSEKQINLSEQLAGETNQILTGRKKVKESDESIQTFEIQPVKDEEENMFFFNYNLEDNGEISDQQHRVQEVNSPFAEIIKESEEKHIEHGVNAPFSMNIKGSEVIPIIHEINSPLANRIKESEENLIMNEHNSPLADSIKEELSPESDNYTEKFEEEEAVDNFNILPSKPEVLDREFFQKNFQSPLIEPLEPNIVIIESINSKSIASVEPNNELQSYNLNSINASCTGDSEINKSILYHPSNIASSYMEISSNCHNEGYKADISESEVDFSKNKSLEDIEISNECDSVSDSIGKGPKIKSKLSLIPKRPEVPQNPGNLSNWKKSITFHRKLISFEELCDSNKPPSITQCISPLMFDKTDEESVDLRNIFKADVKTFEDNKEILEADQNSQEFDIKLKLELIDKPVGPIVHDKNEFKVKLEEESRDENYSKGSDSKYRKKRSKRATSSRSSSRSIHTNETKSGPKCRSISENAHSSKQRLGPQISVNPQAVVIEPCFSKTPGKKNPIIEKRAFKKNFAKKLEKPSEVKEDMDPEIIHLKNMLASRHPLRKKNMEIPKDHPYNQRIHTIISDPNTPNEEYRLDADALKKRQERLQRISTIYSSNKTNKENRSKIRRSQKSVSPSLSDFSIKRKDSYL